MKSHRKQSPIAIWLKSMAGLTFVTLSLTSCFLLSTRISLSLTGQKDMNSGGYAVLVCLYQLKSDINFARAPLESFWKEEDCPFQDDLVVPRKDVMLAPGESQDFEVKVSKETRFIGIAADFRKPDKDQWRKIYPLSSIRDDRLIIKVGVGGIEVKT